MVARYTDEVWPHADQVSITDIFYENNLKLFESL